VKTLSPLDTPTSFGLFYFKIMAEGKKSFILYSDQEYVFSELTDEQAGKLIKHIYNYVNDRNPELNDQLLKVCFAPIKLQLKRDLEKWQQKQYQRSEAGKRSAESRKRNLTTVNEREQTSTVNVNVNGNVNNNKAFVADANKDENHYRLYLFDIVKQKQSSRDILFKNNSINVSLRNQLWEDFIRNSIVNTPLIENEKHAWNTFKKFIIDNKLKYQYKKDSLSDNPE